MKARRRHPALTAVVLALAVRRYTSAGPARGAVK
jgi:hypothetical protein